MDFNAVRAIRDLKLPKELRSYKVQLLVFATCWETIGSRVFPSEQTLGDWCGCSVATIRTAVHKLRDAGYITIQLGVPPGGSKYLSNHYGVGPVLKDYIIEALTKKPPPTTGASS